LKTIGFSIVLCFLAVFSVSYTLMLLGVFLSLVRTKPKAHKIWPRRSLFVFIIVAFGFEKASKQDFCWHTDKIARKRRKGDNPRIRGKTTKNLWKARLLTTRRAATAALAATRKAASGARREGGRKHP
jgi:hypothetical protein